MTTAPPPATTVPKTDTERVRQVELIGLERRLRAQFRRQREGGPFERTLELRRCLDGDYSRREPAEQVKQFTIPNIVRFPTIPLLPMDCYIKVNFAVPVSGPTPTPSFVRTSFWPKKENGLQLLYKGTAILTYNEPAGLVWEQFIAPGPTPSRFDAVNNSGPTERAGFNITFSSYKIDCQFFCDIIQKLQLPLSIYDAGAWRIQLITKKLDQIVDVSGMAPADAPAVATITDIQLVMKGEWITDEKAFVTSQQMLNVGISLHYYSPTLLSGTYLSTDSQFILQDSNIDTKIGLIAIMSRTTTAITSTNALLIDPDAFNFDNYRRYTSTLSIGVKSDPTRFMGIPHPIREMLTQQIALATEGNIFVASDGIIERFGVILWSFSSNPVLDIRSGLCHGGQRVKNDLRFTIDFDPAEPLVNGTIDIVVYEERILLITANSGTTLAT